MKRLLCTAVLLAAALPVLAQQKIIASQSSITFVSRQMNVPVEGQFKRFDATVSFDPKKPEATKAQFEVDLASIDLGSVEGDTEVKKKAWLDVPGFPKARFVASSVKSLGPNKYEASGALTIKGVTQDVVAPFTLREANGVRIVEGEFPVRRLQYRIGEGAWAATDTVADEVRVRFRFALAAG
jgi:polyisoprenoid-binding protein YceI